VFDPRRLIREHLDGEQLWVACCGNACDEQSILEHGSLRRGEFRRQRWQQRRIKGTRQQLESLNPICKTIRVRANNQECVDPVIGHTNDTAARAPFIPLPPLPGVIEGP
jgi:hypothetical protein